MIYIPPGFVVAEQTFNRQDVLGLQLSLLINGRSGVAAVKLFSDDAAAAKEPVDGHTALLKYMAPAEEDGSATPVGRDQDAVEEPGSREDGEKAADDADDEKMDNKMEPDGDRAGGACEEIDETGADDAGQAEEAASGDPAEEEGVSG
jgi:hypothetical protein